MGRGGCNSIKWQGRRLNLSRLPGYDAADAKQLPHLVCIITGKGPLKAHYERVGRMTDLPGRP